MEDPFPDQPPEIVTESDKREAMAYWDELIPEYAGLLDAVPERDRE